MIAGPTGIGKTDLAVRLAERLNGELVSCDSVQVYRGLCIGANKTATPVRQHLVDLVDWREPFTAADFVTHCTAAVRDIFARGKTPILVGGTGLYLDWLLNGRPGAPPSDAAAVRDVDAAVAQDGSWGESLQRLADVDAAYAQAVLPNDYYRLKRALVVHRMTGRTLASFGARTQSLQVDWRCVYLTVSSREALLAHIDRRCEEMVARGLIAEVRALRRDGLTAECPAGRAIGYKETLDLLERLDTEAGEEQRHAALLAYLDTFASQTRQYTRKQEKWFRSMGAFRWVERPSLHATLPESCVEEAAALFRLSRAEYDDGACDANRRSAAFREQCRPSADPKARARQLRAYRSTLQIYGDPAARKDLLDSLQRPW